MSEAYVVSLRACVCLCECLQHQYCVLEKKKGLNLMVPFCAVCSFGTLKRFQLRSTMNFTRKPSMSTWILWPPHTSLQRYMSLHLYWLSAVSLFWWFNGYYCNDWFRSHSIYGSNDLYTANLVTDMFSFLELGLFGRAPAHFRESLHKISIESLLSKKTVWHSSYWIQPRSCSGSSAEQAH